MAKLKQLTPYEKETLRQELEKEEPGITKKLDACNHVVDVLHEREKPYTGEMVYGGPLEMEIILDFTGNRGSGSNIYHSFIYQMPKWRYTVKKVDESIVVSPAYTEYYERTLAQREKLEAAIKTGLASAAQAVADYELMKHDYRRYKEVLDYFKTATKEGDEHVLRNLFIDRVDAYTGEGYSMVTMAKRWPTIITDFIRMKSEWTDIDKIRRELDVSQAEATVLKTKNQLYKEWKVVFEPDLKERFARIETMMNARKKSMDEYKNWLKPYIAKYTSIKDAGVKNPAHFVSNAYVTPGFGQSEAVTSTKLWVWKSFPPTEAHKPEMRYKAKGEWRIDPYDDVVKKWQRRIEYKYNVVFTEDNVRSILKDAKTKPPDSDVSMMDPDDLYYILFDMNFILGLLKTPPPEGIEIDNLMVAPMKAWIMSQNGILIHILEINAREAAIEHYINEIIGAREIEEETLERIEKEFSGKEETEKKPRFAGARSAKRRIGNALKRFARLFVKPGPYEPIFFERVSKMYFRASGQYYVQTLNFLKKKMEIE